MTMSPTSSTWTVADDIAEGTVSVENREREEEKEENYDDMS